MNARNGSELALFNDCFELKDGERITASKLCEIMKLRGYKKYDTTTSTSGSTLTSRTTSSCARSGRETCARGSGSSRASRSSDATLAARPSRAVLSHSELTVLEGSSGSDDGPVVSVVPEVI